MASEQLAWFEFLLTPSLLETHLNQSSPVPTPIDLLIQFIFHGIKRSESSTNEISQDSDERLKQYRLAILPLQIAAHLNWRLSIFETSLPLHIMNDLLMNFLFETHRDMPSEAAFGSIDIDQLEPHQLFSVSIYHRYALRALVNNKLPSKPLKVSNVVIPGQQDPTLESREVHESIVANLERNVENSLRMLEKLLAVAEMKAATIHCFSTTISAEHGFDEHHWDKCNIVPKEQFKCQIHYDLGVYYFMMERYGDAFHHFTESNNLYPNIGSDAKYCNIDPRKLKGYYSSCASVCGRNTPVEKRSLYDQLKHALDQCNDRNIKYDTILTVLIEDNLATEIPFCSRQNLELDLLLLPENEIPGGSMLIFKVKTLNVIRRMLQGEVWDNSYVLTLLKAGRPGAQYLVEVLSSKMRQYNSIQKDRIRNFLITLKINEEIGDILIFLLTTFDASLASLFTRNELGSIASKQDDIATKLTKSAFDVSLGADYTDVGDLSWDIIHSYDPELLNNAIREYIKAMSSRTNKRDVTELNINWELPIPVHNTLMKFPPSPQRHMIFIFIAKADEAAGSKSYNCSLDLLSEACNLLVNSGANNRDSGRLFKMITWLILITKIQRCLDELPCVEESVMVCLTAEAKKCLASINAREGVVPWSNVVNWCLLLLINVQDWSTILNGLPLPQHIPLLAMAEPLAATAQSLQDKNTNKKAWYELWESVLSVLSGSNSGGMKRNTPDRHMEPGMVTRAGFLEFVGNIKEASCLSIFISLLGHCLNTLNDEPTCDVHIDHLAMWPSSLSVDADIESVKDTLNVIVNHATKLYPAASHTSISLCTSWHLTKADLAFLNEEYQSAMQSYLTAIFVPTDYLRNDASTEHIVNSDLITKRMIRCCMKLNCYTQAAILCQFLESIDYNTALRCLQERNSVDAMDAYYNCLWDVTLMEFIINMHQKRGEIHRRDKVLKMIGLLEVNSNNNEEIQREAAKSRKHRFLRALAKQYL